MSPDYQIVQILKTKRLEQGLTLEETSSGICSLSYLSKVENQVIPSVSEEYLDKLYERLNVKSEEVEKLATIDDLVNAFKALNYKDYNKIEELVNGLNKGGFTSIKGLIYAIYYLTNNKHDKFLDVVKSLDTIKFTMTGYEAIMFLYLMALYNNTLHNYLESIVYLSKLDSVYINDSLLRLSVYQVNLIAAFHTRNYIRFLKIFNSFNEFVVINNHYKTKIMINMMYNIIIASEFPEIVNQDLKSIEFFDLDSEEYCNALYYELLTKIIIIDNASDYISLFNEMVKYDKEILYNSRIFALFSYLAYLINSPDQYWILKKNYSKIGYLDPLNQDNEFIHFVIMYASNIDNERFIEYMRINLIDKLHDKQHFLYDDVYKNVYSEIEMFLSRYKDVAYLERDIKFSKKFIDRRSYCLDI